MSSKRVKKIYKPQVDLEFEDIDGRPDQRIVRRVKIEGGNPNPDLDTVAIISADKLREEIDENGNVTCYDDSHPYIRVSVSAADAYKKIVKNTLVFHEGRIDKLNIGTLEYAEKDIAELIENNLIAEHKNPDGSLEYSVQLYASTPTVWAG